MNTGESPLEADTRVAVIDAVLSRLRAKYVFPEIAEAMDQAIRRRLQNGEYDTLTTAAAFADRLTMDLGEVCHDKHLRVVYSAEPRPIRAQDELSPEEREEVELVGAVHNYGFVKVEVLDGSVGYLYFRHFAPPQLGGATAIAAMQFLAGARALIVDLRDNGGGHPGMVALISSYLFTEPTHLNSLYWREGNRTEQFWTLPYVPGRRDGTRPVYVLTSKDTFSGAEEFCYNLKQLKRATLIGETTGGGANPGGLDRIDEHFGVWIPTGSAVNPITGGNWEGTGVVPDIEVPREEAFKVAYSAALKTVIASEGTRPTRLFHLLAQDAREALARL